uniref:Junctional cadherin 5 associated a n=1 Tax=Oryzias latipes TaxID=8090 RepID=A0A3B3HAY1_ORYLA
MYSVEDLLISHGYKLPKNSASSTQTPVPTSSSHQPPPSSPPSYSKHHEALESRHGPRTANGYERGPAGAFGSISGTRQPQAYGGSSPNNNNNEPRERSQTKQEGESRGHADSHSLGEEREAALHQWRMAAERKCHSLGTEEWNPAVIFGRQLSQSEGERWAQDQHRLHARTPDGMVVHPRTKVKSQSLPRMVQPESLQYIDVVSSGQELYKRVNGHPFAHHQLYRAPRWAENGRPPSYEMHQQIRGSCEVLSGRESVIPQARDRTPIPMSRPTDPHLDYFAQDSGPPGYIPPPSYKRVPIMGGGGNMYQQIHVAPDGSHWFIRHPASSWPHPQRERSLSSQKQLCPIYSNQEHSTGSVQYIPFDDPRIRHISSALGGNSLTDADKIRHIRKELPSVTVSESATNDSAFLPPPLGPFITAKPAAEANQISPSDFDNDNKRWRSDLHKQTVDNFPAPDQNLNNRHLRNQLPTPSTSSAFQVPLPRTSPRQGSRSDQIFAETITQVKKIAPDSGPENYRNTKRRVSETIFCLVSVPLHTPTNISKDLVADQNNNEAIPNLTMTKTDTFAVGLKESLNIRSKSVNEMPIKSCYSHFHTSNTSSMRNYKRAPLRKEIIDAWALQANEDLCYARSWPGNQYRNQETQTGSPLTVVKSPEPQSPPCGEEPALSASNATTDLDVRSDSSASYGYPMAGQKHLNPSSNSAFSRLSPAQMPTQQDSPQQPSSPSKASVQSDQQPSSPQKIGSPDSAEHVVFGQFLLKPVNRRPCDAIGELETINKEMEETISKRPIIEDSLLSPVSSNNELNQHCRQDIPVPQESLLRNVGLTVYTESPSRPMQRSRSAPFPLDHEAPTPSMSISLDTRSGLVKTSCSLDFTSNEKPRDWLNSEKTATSDKKVVCLNGSISRSGNESCQPLLTESLPQRKTKEVSFAFENEVDKKYALPEPLTYKNDSTITDKHLESLLIQEKAKTLPVEDLSKLYEIKCAEGIPENESIEERAARILGISVPVGALGVGDKHIDDNQVDLDTSPREKRPSPNEETKNAKECEEVKEELLLIKAPTTVQVKVTGSGDDQKEHKDDKEKHNSEHRDHQGIEIRAGTENPEIPPLPVTAEEKPAVSASHGDKKGKSGASKVIESIQDKLNSSYGTLLALSSTERRARFKELDSVSRIRRLSLKGPDSVIEVISKDTNVSIEECEASKEIKLNVEQQPAKQVKEEKQEKWTHALFSPSFSSDSYDPSRVERV